MAKDHGPTVNDDNLYETLRKQGNSKEKSARIANAAHTEGRAAVSRRGGKSPSYDEWTKHDLYKRAKELEIHGRSSMSKSQLVDALRNH